MALARLRSLGLFVAVLTMGARPDGRVQAQPGPLTPGTTAALVFRKGQEDRERLPSAVVDADPRVRAAAARVAAVLEDATGNVGRIAAMAVRQAPAHLDAVTPL